MRTPRRKNHISDVIIASSIMKLFILTLSILLPVTLSSESIDGCYFSSNSTTDLTCSALTLTVDKLQPFHPDHVIDLDLTRVEVDMDKDLAKTLPELKYLMLDECDVKEFNPEFGQLQNLYFYDTTFPGESNFDKCCPDLNYLVLWNVTGINLDRSVLKNLNSLELLAINHQPFQRLTKNTFTGLNSLKKLLIRDINFDNSDRDFFSELTHLEELYLINDEIADVHVELFKPLKALKVLSIGAKRLKALPLEVFSGLSELRELSLPEGIRKELTDTKVREMLPKLKLLDNTDETKIITLS